MILIDLALKQYKSEVPETKAVAGLKLRGLFSASEVLITFFLNQIFK